MSTSTPVINRLYSTYAGEITGDQNQIKFYHGLKENMQDVIPDWAQCTFTSMSTNIISGAVGGQPGAVLTALDNTMATFRIKGMRIGDECNFNCMALRHNKAGNTGAGHIGKLTGTDGVTNATTAFTSASGGFSTYVKVGDTIVLHENGNSLDWLANIDDVYTVVAVTTDNALVLSGTPDAGTGQSFTVEGPAAAVLRDVAGAAQVPFHLPGGTAYATGVVTNINAEFPGTDIDGAEIDANAITTALLANDAVTNAKVDAAAAIDVTTKLTRNLALCAVANVANYIVARGQATVAVPAGTVDVNTTLGAIVAGVVTLAEDPVFADSYPWITTTWAAGTLTIKAWRPTATNDANPLAAANNTQTVDWVAIGTA